MQISSFDESSRFRFLSRSGSTILFILASSLATTEARADGTQASQSTDGQPADPTRAAVAPAPTGPTPEVAPDAKSTAPLPPAGPVVEAIPPVVKEPSLPDLDKKIAAKAPRGFTAISIMPASYTITGANPAREKLADWGFSYYGYSINTAQQNLLNASRSARNGDQQYFGQKASAYSLSNLMLAYSFDSIGLPDTQIQGGIGFATTTWEPAGPKLFSTTGLALYQSLFDRAVELKVGLLSNSYEFVGTYVGDNLASAIFGASSTIPAETGMSDARAPKPGANITLHWGNYYSKFGAAVSSSPEGYVAEKRDNVSGFKWKTANSNGLIVEEVGFRRAASAKDPKTWVRVGYIRNWSDYTDYAHGGRSSQNYSFYALGDHQVLRFNNGNASGLNIGGSAFLGLDRYAPIAQSYEARFYVTGPFHSRPGDVISFIATDNVFSQYVVNAVRKAGGFAKEGSWVLTWAYSAAIAPGTYAGLGLAYADHPTVGAYTPDDPVAGTVGTRHALMPIGNVSMFF